MMSPPRRHSRRRGRPALARAAEARAKDAEQKCEQAEGRLEQELRERLLAEQRLKELEANRQRQQHSVVIEVEAPQPRTSSWAQGGHGAVTGTWMKESRRPPTTRPLASRTGV